MNVYCGTLSFDWNNDIIKQASGCHLGLTSALNEVTFFPLQRIFFSRVRIGRSQSSHTTHLIYLSFASGNEQSFQPSN